MKKKILMYSALVIALPTVAYLLYYKLSNPDMTDMRMFLNRWPFVIIGFISVMTFLKLYGEKD